MNIIEILNYEWAQRALIASIMVGIMCGVLGVFIVLRNMSLIGDALSHAILPGVVFGFMIAGYSLLGFFIGAVVAGLVSAVAITWLQQRVQTKNDAAIGIVFTAMFSIGVMAISWISRSEGVHLDLQDFLFGNVLGVSDDDLYLTGFITCYVLASVIVFYRYLFATTFQPVIAQTMGISVEAVHYFLMLLLSFAVVASLKTVGVILVVAMLITPASMALLLSDRLPVVIGIAALAGFVSAVLGLVLAIVFETTPGPAMAVTSTLLYLLAVFFSPQKGLVFKSWYQWQTRRRIVREDVLKQALKLHEAGNLSFKNLQTKIGSPARVLRREVERLAKTGELVVAPNGGGLTLTTAGIAQANQLVRAHRLWETYLVKEIGLNTEQIHEDAEKYEHLLSEELLDEIDRHTGYPTIDPHGAPIPPKKVAVARLLAGLAVGERAAVADLQTANGVYPALWRLGIRAKTPFVVVAVEPTGITIAQDGSEVFLPTELAATVQVAPLSHGE